MTQHIKPYFSKLTTWSLAALLLLATLLAGCATAALTAAIIDQQNKQPKLSWSGIVRDATGEPIEDVAVRVSYDRQPENEQDGAEDLTDADGRFNVKLAYFKHAMYSVNLVYGKQSTAPVFYQDQFIEKEDIGNLEFTFNVDRPEQQFDWTGVLGEGTGGSDYRRLNKALVMLQLDTVDDVRRFWTESGDGGIFQFPYDWNQRGTYTFEVVSDGALRKIDDYTFQSNDVDVPGQTFTDEDPLDDAGSTIARGPHYNVLRIEESSAPPKPLHSYKGRILYSGSKAPVANALAILCLGGTAGSGNDSIRLAQRDNTRFFWAHSDSEGNFEIIYDKDDDVAELELVVDRHVLRSQAHFSDTEREQFSVDLQSSTVDSSEPVLESLLSGTVLDHRGEPVAEQPLFLTRSRDGVSTVFTAVSDPEGRYEIAFEWLANAQFHLTTNYYGRAVDELIDDLDGSQTFDLKLAVPVFQWNGRITRPNGDPISTASVALDWMDSTGANAGSSSGTDQAGNYSFPFDWDAEYEYVISVELAGTPGVSASVRIGKVAAMDHTTDLVVAAPATFTWTGSVLDLQGSGIENASVRLVVMDGTDSVLDVIVLSEADGSYSISYPWKEGYEYTVSVTLQGHDTADSSVEVGSIAAGNRVSNFSLDDSMP